MKQYYAALLLGTMVVGIGSTYEAAAGGASNPNGDAQRGAELFRNECGLCHQAADGDGEGGQGPSLRGVLGRRIGGGPDFTYSPALSASTDVWTIDRLDHFLADPEKAFPGNWMPTNVPVAKDRTDIAAYLATVTAAP